VEEKRREGGQNEHEAGLRKQHNTHLAQWHELKAVWVDAVDTVGWRERSHEGQPCSEHVYGVVVRCAGGPPCGRRSGELEAFQEGLAQLGRQGLVEGGEVGAKGRLAAVQDLRAYKKGGVDQ